MIRFLLMWFSLLATAFLNGALREMTYGRVMDPAWAHRVSVFTGMALTGLVAGLLLSKWRPVSLRSAVTGGLLWFVMTEVFEFSMTVLFSRKSIDFFISMHDLFAGELWPLFLVWIAAFPSLFYGLTRLHPALTAASGHSRRRSRS